MWKIKKIIKVLFFVALALTVFGYLVMLLWNALVPELFKGPYITFWQAAGLLLLSHILFHGINPKGGGGHWKRAHWRKHWEQKMANMSPEEREKFKSEWFRRCGWAGGWYTNLSQEEQDKLKEEWMRRWGWSPEAEEKFRDSKESLKHEWKRFMRYPDMSPEEREQFKQEMKRWWMEHSGMSPEEKERFKEEMKRRWGWTPEAEEKFRKEWQWFWGYNSGAEEK